MQTKRCCITMLAALIGGISCLWAQEPTAVTVAGEPVAVVTTEESAAVEEVATPTTPVPEVVAAAESAEAAPIQSSTSEMAATPIVADESAVAAEEPAQTEPALDPMIFRKEIFVTFRVNRIDIDPSYMDNATAIEAMVQWIKSYNNDDDTDIISVEICGSASPEGSSERNSYLSRSRLAALEKYLRARIDIPEELIIRNDHYISLDHLSRLVANSDFSQEDKDSILKIAGRGGVDVDTRVTQLRHLDGGRLWKMMLSELFPEMRNAYTIIVTRQHDYDAEGWVSALPLYSSQRNFSEDVVEEYTEGDKTITLRKKEKFVTFPVGKSVLDTTYMNNAAAIQSMLEWINDFEKDEMVDLVSVEISGSASPEGSSARNKALSAERLSALENYLRSHLEIPDSIIVRNDHYVSLHHLAELVDASPAFTEAQKSLVYAMAYDESQSVESRIARLQKFHGGKLWNKMLKTVYPEMRNAFAVIVTRKSAFAEKVDAVAEEIEAEYSQEKPEEIVELIPVEQPTEEQPAEETVTESEDQPAEETMAESEEQPTEEASDEPTFRKWYVKNNVVMDAMAITNVGVEFDLFDHWSLALPVYYSAWNYFNPDWKFRILGAQPEVRYWPMGNSDGLFVGAHFGVASFNIATGGDWRYQDHDGEKPALGGGLSVGYRLPLTKNGRLKMEFAIGGGAYKLHWDEFYNVEDGLLANTYKKTYWGLDNVSVTFSYAFNLKKVNK